MAGPLLLEWPGRKIQTCPPSSQRPGAVPCWFPLDTRHAEQASRISSQAQWFLVSQTVAPILRAGISADDVGVAGKSPIKSQCHLTCARHTLQNKGL
ncbi:hypothetical protein FKM82_025034 [Ascaphus truei]